MVRYNLRSKAQYGAFKKAAAVLLLACGMVVSGCSSRITTNAGSGTSTVVGFALPFIGLVQNDSNRFEPMTPGRMFASLFFANAVAAGCSAEASIYALSPATGDKVGVALGSGYIQADGSFVIANLSSAHRSALSGGSNVGYILEASGCGLTHTRAATGLTGQNITAATTLLSYVANVSGGNKMTDVKATKVASLLSKIPASATSTEQSVFTWLNTPANSAVKTEFESLFSISLSDLQDAAPTLLSLTAPTTINENSTTVYATATGHWNPTYSTVYIWKKDGVAVSTSASYSYTPGADEEGIHSIVLYVGKDDGLGGLDLTKPYHAKSYAVTVTNNVPPTAPGLTLGTPSSSPLNTRNLTLTMNTGVAMANCASFSGLAITENDAVAPANPAAYATTCNSAGTQNVAYTLVTAGDGVKTLRLWARDSAGNISSTPTTLSVLLDSAAPVVTAASMSINGGATTTNNNHAQVSLSAADATTKITKFCLKYNTTTAPTVSDTCWIPVNAPSPGLTPALTLALANYNFLLGFSPGLYSVYAWLIDEAGNISTLTSAGAGTDGTDKAAITYAPGTPPTVVNVAAFSTDTPSSPPVSNDLTVSNPGNVYIKWSATDDQALPANPVSLYYTTDDSTYTLIVANVANASNGGCTVTAGYTGCYVWNQNVTSGYLKVRVAVIDSNSMSSLAATSINTWPPINFLAGNTDPGTNGAATSAMFFSDNSSVYYDPNSLLVADNGIIYFRDVTRGIMKIDPADGNARVWIPLNASLPSSNGDGGPVTAATVKTPYKIALDFQNRVLIFDAGRIRRVNTDQTPVSIETIIGGGAQTGDGVAATDVKVTDPGAYSFSNRNAFFALPNGDIYFQSENFTATPAGGARIRVFSANTGLVTSIYPSGLGESFNASQDIAECYLYGFAVVFDPVTSVISQRIASSGHSQGLANCWNNRWASMYSLNAAGVSTAPHAAETQPGQDHITMRVVGHDGNIYSVSRVYGKIWRYNPGTLNWTVLVGTGAPGVCADGTVATSCAADPYDVYVTAQGTVYFMDRGKIRVIDSAGKVQTLFGQGFAFGDGGSALSARFNNLQFVHMWNNAGSDTIVVSDRFEARLREFTRSGNIQTIAGNGTQGWPNTTTAANTQPIMTASSNNGAWDAFQLDSSGNVYYARASTSLSKLNRATGNWENLVGGGGTSYTAANGLLGSAISLPTGFPLAPMGFDGTNLLAMLNGYVGGAFADVMWSLYSKTDGTQTDFIGAAGINASSSTTFAADGTNAIASTSPAGSGMINAAYDSFGSRWILGTRGYTRLVATNPGSTISTLVNLPRSIRAFAYRHDASHNIVYYCPYALPGKLYKYDIATSTETALAWPVGSMSCAGLTLEFNPNGDGGNGSLVFIYTQNGMYGVAEYLNP